MKITQHLLLTCIAAAVALPTAALAAKADRKKPAATAVTFATADKDSDGAVTKDEYVAALKASLGEEAATTKFGTLDKDHDGKLTKEEYGTDTGTEKKKRRKKAAN
jgi:Ca2+-binding EF-hand superfamily protein